jgi:hypothetical protein
MTLKRENDGVIDEAEQRSSKVSKTKTRTVIQPLIPAQDPSFGRGTYIIYLCCDEPSDSDFAAGLRLCQQNCAANVQNFCFQQDGTRHISLWEGYLWDAKVREIEFPDSPQLPTVAFKPGWNSWKAGNYIEVRPHCTKELKEILTQLRPPLPKGKVSCDHLSLYRKRGARDVSSEFQRVRKALESHNWGTLSGGSIRIKQLGAAYDQCKVLAATLGESSIVVPRGSP